MSNLKRMRRLAILLTVILLPAACVVQPGYRRGVVQVQSQPQFDRWDYYYYPDAEVYFNSSTGYYFYYSNGGWITTLTLPSRFILHHDHRVHLRIQNDRPYIYHKQHLEKYRPRKATPPVRNHDRDRPGKPDYRYDDDRRHDRDHDSRRDYDDRRDHRQDSRYDDRRDHRYEARPVTPRPVAPPDTEWRQGLREHPQEHQQEHQQKEAQEKYWQNHQQPPRATSRPDKRHQDRPEYRDEIRYEAKPNAPRPPAARDNEWRQGVRESPRKEEQTKFLQNHQPPPRETSRPDSRFHNKRDQQQSERHEAMQDNQREIRPAPQPVRQTRPVPQIENNRQFNDRAQNLKRDNRHEARPDKRPPPQPAQQQRPQPQPVHQDKGQQRKAENAKKHREHDKNGRYEKDKRESHEEREGRNRENDRNVFERDRRD